MNSSGNPQLDSQLGALATEARNPASTRLDTLSTLEMLGVMNDEDARVAAAVRAELPAIALAVDQWASGCAGCERVSADVFRTH